MWYIGLYHSVIYNLSLTLWKIQQCIYQIEYLPSIHFHEEPIHFTGRLLLFFTPAVHSGGLFHFYLCCTFFQVDYFFYMFYTLQVCHSILTCCTPDRWVILFLPAIHLGKVGRGLQVPSRHTYSAGSGYSNLNPVGQEIEHCIVVGVLWHVAVPLTGLAGVRHLPSAEEVAERKKLTFQLNFTTFHVYFNFSNFYCMSTFSQLQDKNYNSW